MSTKATYEMASLEDGSRFQKNAIANPTYDYYQREEKLHGFLSQQFPTIANPAPLGLAAFALTTFVLSMLNAGAIVSMYQILLIANTAFCCHTFS